MPQKRDLHPITVYLPPAAITFYEREGAATYEAVSATLRRLILADLIRRMNADLVEIVSHHTSLKKQGGRYIGRCPFHEEKTSSFSVNAEEGLYHCFGCERGGDAVSFIMEIEKCSFAEALERLVQQVG